MTAVIWCYVGQHPGLFVNSRMAGIYLVTGLCQMFVQPCRGLVLITLVTRVIASGLGQQQQLPYVDCQTRLSRPSVGGRVRPTRSISAFQKDFGRVEECGLHGLYQHSKKDFVTLCGLFFDFWFA